MFTKNQEDHDEFFLKKFSRCVLCAFVVIIVISIFLCCSNLSSQEKLRKRITEIISFKKAVTGVAIIDLSNDNTLGINANTHFPMQSVYKFHLALTVLDLVDKKKLSLDQPIFISKNDLHPDMWSPLRDDFPKGDTALALSEILKYTVSKSDNNGCDILFKLIGGPSTVNGYIHSLGINDVSIVANEETMHKDWNVQFTNWTTPLSAAMLLKSYHDQLHLSKTSSHFLWYAMVDATTGNNKIKGQLPKDALVAHKSGLSAKNEKGITGASNDIALVSLPDGRQFAIAVFVSNSSESEETNEKIIADISKAAWDYFLEK